MGFLFKLPFSLCLILLLLLLFNGTFGILEDNNNKAALLAFKNGIFSDPKNHLQNWRLDSNLHFCNWTGIECNNVTHKVVSIDLSRNSIHGTISPFLSNLSSLTILDLSDNFFEGQIPKELGSLRNLEQLDLKLNLLTGKIPMELQNLNKLEYLHFGSNKLEGKIPELLFCNGSSSSLIYIDLSNNSLSGKIPLKNGCEMKGLEKFLLWANKFEGQIPSALLNSTTLQWLDLGSNKLSGELPVMKMPSLVYLYLFENEFVSHDGNSNLEPFFSSFLNSSKLQQIDLASNHLGGEIPSIIGDLHANLSELHLSNNLIHGSIPPSISKLINLTVLNLSGNLLNGTIPFEVGRLRKLESIQLSNNLLSGEIPYSLGEIQPLSYIDFSRNKLSGSVPETLANLSQLRQLWLYGNHLSGTIPPSLGKCNNLDSLDLSSNQISGVIPSEIAVRTMKIYLNLSRNHLHGPLPLELSKMDMILAIDLSSNNLSGPIPSRLGNCIALEYLNLSYNSFDGSLPFSIGQFPSLQTLDVSFNQLIGNIPDSLQTSSSLKQLNISFNNFSGRVPDKGVFSWLTMYSFLGNNGLCGSIIGLPKCRERHKFNKFLPILLCSSVAFVFCIAGIVFALRLKTRLNISILNRRGFEECEEQITERKEMKYPRISYRQLVDATDGFSSSNLIGSGRFGEVYKGILPDKTKIAVKVLKPIRIGGEISGSFKRECQVLKRTRHRNLIRIITTCSRPDFNALVLPLMSNGSLESYLYPNNRGSSIHKPDLAQLVSICSDVAQGVAYLHHHSPIRVVHCDIKPSNILLDDDMAALVTDFGISRLIIQGETNNSTSHRSESTSFSSTHGLLCGSVGYIAPEYGLGERASTEGDVFSFGVLLLEVVTGKRPTDLDFQQGAGLHEWVKSHYPHKLDDIVDEAMERYGFSTPNVAKQFPKLRREVIFELLELSIMCTQYTPSFRPSMVDVAHEMTRLKEHLLNSSSLLIREASPANDEGC
ncbi:putative leucine-rich repeat receptor-like serine/threonine-protein kinase [Cucumis melo var. makuwa]|uniref:non-specific serine/threonine protein kinase n=1 Tax=Cucumis melo var. makuwa TaxID=1194695 RepID=A0A5D3BAJ1_CUCMM|nr:putative leucine-rich repeat receptor-like serine/threonine-protein kinase [Cucumis melo var. makuwa]